MACRFFLKFFWIFSAKIEADPLFEADPDHLVKTCRIL